MILHNFVQFALFRANNWSRFVDLTWVRINSDLCHKFSDSGEIQRDAANHWSLKILLEVVDLRLRHISIATRKFSICVISSSIRVRGIANLRTEYCRYIIKYLSTRIAKALMKLWTHEICKNKIKTSAEELKTCFVLLSAFESSVKFLRGNFEFMNFLSVSCLSIYVSCP